MAPKGPALVKTRAANTEEPESRLCAGDLHPDPDDHPIFVLAVAIDDAKKINRRCACYLETATEPQLSRPRPGPDQIRIRPGVKRGALIGTPEVIDECHRLD